MRKITNNQCLTAARKALACHMALRPATRAALAHRLAAALGAEGIEAVVVPRQES